MHWLLCSSGARDLYLENIVRSLALPSGQNIRFRYDESIVSDHFKQAFATNDLAGSTAYVVYFDEKRSIKNGTNYVPTRVVEIVRCRLIGSSYILDLCIQDYINLRSTAKLVEYLQQQNSILDPLPHQRTAGQRGYWVAALNKSLHKDFISKGQGSFKAFEETVTALEKHVHFSQGQYKFFTVFDFRRKNGPSTFPSFKTISGKTYVFSVYHYTTIPVATEDFLITLKSNDPIIRMGSVETARLETSYDLVDVPFTIKEKSLWGDHHIYIDVFKEAPPPTTNNTCSLEIELKNNVNWKAMIPICLLITAGLSIAQLTRLDLSETAKLEPWLQILVIFSGSLIAAAAATFGVKKSL